MSGKDGMKKEINTSATAILIKITSYLKSQKYKHRVTEKRSYTEKAYPNINALCCSVPQYLSVKNIFETGSKIPGSLFIPQYLQHTLCCLLFGINPVN
jgi:hypothetical protein